ncbi:MAG: 4-alpha-glucanotransferase [Anaerolineales bacterium]|nr:4-alpha-glucanotransferase [Anaerolineales bacterium]
MKFERQGGILLHPTSLFSPYGIGDLGPGALTWIDFLAAAGCRLWQVLPLGPTGYGDSPYQSFSTFAGNPYLISPQVLLEEGLLTPDDLKDIPPFSSNRVDFGLLISWKLALLEKAFFYFERSNNSTLETAFTQYKQEQSAWLDDYALFMALKEAHQGQPWPHWEASLRDRRPKALANARQKFSRAIQQQAFYQFIFFRQWHNVRQYAVNHNIRIIGDIPIFVAHDSSDVWAHRNLYYLDDKGYPTVVAGVPPDYFSKTGQLWGNPLYNWEKHARNGYSWWIQRISAALKLVDFIRLDHFRGFAGYWEVPGSAPTAEKGRWVDGPGKHFFRTVQNRLGELPFIAEDLGVITPDVVNLRRQFSLPGMIVLQFAFTGEPENPFLPHNHVERCVAYTGTHDNDTARGWYKRVEEKERAFYRKYMDRDGSQVAWDLIRGVWSSVATFAIAPIQDFLNLDNEARMNYPGNAMGNWAWRLEEEALTPELAQKIKELNFLYSRG